MFSVPARNLKNLHLSHGNKVLDVGAGSGHYTVEAALMVGASGHVYALEVQRALVERVDHLVREQGLGNVTTIWGDAEELRGTQLRDASIDRAIIANILFQVEDKNGLLREVFRVLRPGGLVMVVDWNESFGGLGPRADSVVSSDDALELLRTVGFVESMVFDAGEHHYGITMKKPDYQS